MPEIKFDKDILFKAFDEVIENLKDQELKAYKDDHAEFAEDVANFRRVVNYIIGCFKDAAIEPEKESPMEPSASFLNYLQDKK